MVSAAILDTNGHVVPSASHNVTFNIVSGPGRIIGVGNGHPACHEPNQASWRSAYHGLVCDNPGNRGSCFITRALISSNTN